jgi:hypothetical protein
VDPAEFPEYRRRITRQFNLLWIATTGISVGCGLFLGVVWSFAVGAVVAVVLALGGVELCKRWSKARWIKRFPELADSSVQWRDG